MMDNNNTNSSFKPHRINLNHKMKTIHDLGRNLSIFIPKEGKQNQQIQNMTLKQPNFGLNNHPIRPNITINNNNNFFFNINPLSADKVPRPFGLRIPNPVIIIPKTAQNRTTNTDNNNNFFNFSQQTIQNLQKQKFHNINPNALNHPITPNPQGINNSTPILKSNKNDNSFTSNKSINYNNSYPSNYNIISPPIISPPFIYSPISPIMPHSGAFSPNINNNIFSYYGLKK